MVAWSSQLFFVQYHVSHCRQTCMQSTTLRLIDQFVYNRRLISSGKLSFFFITPTVLMVHRKRNHVNKKKTGKRKRWRMVGSRMATRSRYAHKTKHMRRRNYARTKAHSTVLTSLSDTSTLNSSQVCNKDAQDAACSLLTCGPRERTTASHRSPSTWRTPY